MVTNMRPSTDDLKANYTAAQYNGTNSPPSSIWRVGTFWIDPATGKEYIFLKNAGATSIAAKDVCTSLTTDPSTYLCRATAGNSNVEPFAGCRVSGATAVATLEYGWFQIKGNATLTADAAGTAANTGVVISNATVGAVEDMPNTGVGAQASFAVAQAAVQSGDTVVNLFKSIWR